MDSLTEAAPEQLRSFAADMQADLWHRLRDDIARAANEAWSMAASDTARDIVRAARLVGPTPMNKVPWPLLAGGVYEAVLTAGDVPVESLDEDEWRFIEAFMTAHGGTREACQTGYIPTIAQIQTERETNWIRGGDE